MVRLLVGIFAFFWLGVVIAEVVRQAELVATIGSPFLWGALTALAFVAIELVQAFLRHPTTLAGKKPQRLITAYHLFLAFICLVFLFAIPFLWWGVIQELARLPAR